MGRIMQLAAFSLAVSRYCLPLNQITHVIFQQQEVTYSAGDISYQIQESVREASFTVETLQENVSGVILPTFTTKRLKAGEQSQNPNAAQIGTGGNEFGLTGLGRGGQQVQKAREIYARAVETLVELASLQTAFVILDEVIRMTNRRVNALEHVLIPKLENTIKCVFLLEPGDHNKTKMHQLDTSTPS